MSLRKEKGERRKEKGERRKEKGERRKEKGERRKETNGFDDVRFVLWDDDFIGQDVQFPLSKVADDLL